MKLPQAFRSFLRDAGVDSHTKLLLAVSGGLDSMVLLQLAVAEGLEVAVAHVNFKLRGAESDGDEAFVRKATKELGVPLHAKNLPIDKMTLVDGLQAEARRLRYNWFEELCTAHGYDYILTAHHLNDRVETLFINLSRGAGISGLKGMPIITDKILRPLAMVARDEILKYAKANGFTWREDSSNDTEDYLRNRVRQGMAKAFYKLSPKALSKASQSLDYLAEADAFFKGLADEKIRGFQQKGEMILINRAEWNQIFVQKPLHKYIFEKLGFHPDQLNLIESLSQSQSGKRIIGGEYILYKTAEVYVLDKPSDNLLKPVKLIAPNGSLDKPINLIWSLAAKPAKPDPNPMLAYLDLSKLFFPLELRIWKSGDRFKPLGMKGFKKISDFLIDAKLPLPEKKRVFVLCSGAEICWVVGMRIDDRFKMTDETLQVLKLEVKE